MSCWRKTTVLRVPALALGFQYRWEWSRFLEQHRKEFGWDPGWFTPALCENYSFKEHSKWLEGTDIYDPQMRLDLNVYPALVKTVPGPFLDYYIDEVSLRSEERKYGMDDCARPLTPEEKEKYLPLYQKLFPEFTLENMEDVHYCRYEWYDGAEAQYFY